MTRFLSLPDGGQLAVDECGHGPPLVLVSGLGGLASFWQGGARAWAGAHRVIRYDHRGTGRSSPLHGPTSIGAMADDLLALLAKLDVGPVCLVGHSTGGAIAQRLAIDHPEAITRLVLSGSFARPCAYMRRLFEGRLEILHRLGVDAYRRHAAMLLYPPFWIEANDQKLADEQAEAASRSRPEDAAAISHRIRAILAHDCLEELPAIACPTAIVVAADDAVTPPYLSQTLAKRIPGARLTVLPDGGHYVARTRPQAYLDAISPFLGVAARFGEEVSCRQGN